MITGALICEYNPFHNGHKYMLSEMRRDGCECIVAVMSGSFTQRGDVAVFSKFHRTKDALLGGADIVIELPTVWAAASAQRFAQGGCEVIKALGCIDRVYFGSECGDIDVLNAAAKATLDEKVNALTKEYMNEGEYYPNALQKAVSSVYGKETADILSEPNNTLGIEYIKALLSSSIEFRTIKRTGAEHDSQITTDDTASASHIRGLIRKNVPCSAFVPQENSPNSNPAFLENGDRALLYKLRQLTAEEIKNLPDVSEGLENRIYAVIRSKATAEDILSEIKTKRYTHSRIRRILICALLGISKELHEMSVPYLRILGFNSRGEELLKILKTTATLPVITNVAKGYNELNENAKRIFDIDLSATDIRTVFETDPSPCGQDFTNGIVKI